MVGDYDTLQEYLNIEQEYRILVLWNGHHYTIPRAYEKVVVDRNTKRPNFHPNWDFQKRELNGLPTELKQPCITAVQRLQLHFVGVDVAITDQGIKIIEVNTAPGLGVNTARKIYKVLKESNGRSKTF
jgi:glutathione synthase/RimK-type ligase-like ATP-grasp enzyme